MNLQDPEDAMAKLLRLVASQDGIFNAWRVIQENSRTSSSANRKEVDEFAGEAGPNLRSLCFRLSRRRFEFGRARGVPIPKLDGSGQKTGKFRPIVIASVEARIVQRSVLDVLLDVPGIAKYIDTPHSFGGLRRPRIGDGQAKRDNPSAVPAAVKAVLSAIEDGAQFFVSADIRSFFTRVSKPGVLNILGTVVNDAEFIDFVEKAITTELSNLAELKERVTDFPIEEIGVAQGNSLSPLLGNIALSEFDSAMNEGDCRCIRYIDDFIILAPSEKAANSRLRRAKDLLSQLSMELSPEKSAKGAVDIRSGITFLGIDIKPGIIRPSKKARQRFLDSLSDDLASSSSAFRKALNGTRVDNTETLTSTLKRVQGKVDGWGKHYWFCNDTNALSLLDAAIQNRIAAYLAHYRTIRAQLPAEKHHVLLGIPALAEQKRRPFTYPSLAGRPGASRERKEPRRVNAAELMKLSGELRL